MRLRNHHRLGKSSHSIILYAHISSWHGSNVSAEIFVVCRDFHAPKHIDPKFLDPKHVFKEATASNTAVDKGISANNVQANVFHPEKKRRKRDGYDDGNYTLFKRVGVAEFVKATDPIVVLGSVNQMAFETEEERRYEPNLEGDLYGINMPLA